MASEKDGKFFAVRDLPERTRRAIKRFAVEYDVTMAQALEFLIDSAVDDPKTVRRRLDTVATFQKLGGRFYDDTVWPDETRETLGKKRIQAFEQKVSITPRDAAFIMVARIADIQQRMREGKPVTEEEALIIRTWEQADMMRVYHNPAYADELETLRRKQERERRVDEEES